MSALELLAYYPEPVWWPVPEEQAHRFMIEFAYMATHAHNRGPLIDIIRSKNGCPLLRAVYGMGRRTVYYINLEHPDARIP